MQRTNPKPRIKKVNIQFRSIKLTKQNSTHKIEMCADQARRQSGKTQGGTIGTEKRRRKTSSSEHNRGAKNCSKKLTSEKDEHYGGSLLKRLFVDRSVRERKDPRSLQFQRERDVVDC